MALPATYIQISHGWLWKSGETSCGARTHIHIARLCRPIIALVSLLIQRLHKLANLGAVVQLGGYVFCHGQKYRKG